LAIIDNIRYGEDFANAANCIIGESPYQVYLVSSWGEAIDIDTLFNPVPMVYSNRITIADGYRSYLTLGNSYSDGYLYPMIREDQTEIILASGSSFSEKQLIIGPICFPYSITWIDGTTFNGGIDTSVFSPPVGPPNVNYWILVIGPGITGGNGLGSYYSIEQIKLASNKKNGADNICYYVGVKATGFSPPGTS
jgi:hypothetical protein